MSQMEWKPNDFEKSLAKAMRRVDAPETLVESVMFRVDAESIAAPTHVSKARHVAPSWWVAPRAWFGAAAFATAALVLLGVVSGERVHQRHLREAEATQQFETATRITDAALQHTRDQLARAGVSLEQ